MRHRHLLALACSLVPLAVACNAIFGVEPGVGTGSSGSSSTGTGGSSTSTSTSAGGSTTTSASSGPGGSDPCPSAPPCHIEAGIDMPCEPILLSGSIDNYTIGITVFSDRVYWASGDGQITTTTIQGDSLEKFGNGSDSVMVAVYGNTIYWTDWNDGKIRGAKLDASHMLFDVAEMTGDAGAIPRAHLGRIVYRSGRLFWAGEDPNAIWTSVNDGTQVYAIKVADKIDDAHHPDVSIGVAVDATHVYWTDADKVRRIPLSDLGDPTAIEDFATDPGAGEVHVDDTRVYWTSNAGVASVLKDKSNPTLWPVTGDRARAILLDGAYVYWTESSGRILRAPKGVDKSMVTVVAQGPKDAFMLASDCGAIYWGTFSYNHGNVYKVRKPD